IGKSTKSIAIRWWRICHHFMERQSNSPLLNSTGLFLIGPAMPSGRRGLLQVFAIFRSHHHSPPRGWAGAYFVKEQQRPRLRLDQYGIPGRIAFFSRLDAVGDLGAILLSRYRRTYSKSKGWRLVPVAGGAIQFAIFPRSVTGVMRLRTYSRSCSVGNHSEIRRSNSSCEIRAP